MIIMPFFSIFFHSMARKAKNQNFSPPSSLHFRWWKFYIFYAFRTSKKSRRGRSINICSFYVPFSRLRTIEMRKKKSAHLSLHSKNTTMPHHHNWTLFNSMSNVSINKHFPSIILHKKKKLGRCFSHLVVRCLRVVLHSFFLFVPLIRLIHLEMS
jgi:hypothetical protein